MKRYIILIFALICVLLLTGCAGGCNSCSSVTPPTIETVPPETNATEPPEDQNYIGIGLQEPKYIELAAPQTPNADQAFDALLYSVMTSNEYRADANKYRQFTRFNENTLILLSSVDSLICYYDEKTHDVSLTLCTRPEIRDLHTNGTVTVQMATESEFGGVYGLYALPDLTSFNDSSALRPLWTIYESGKGKTYLIWELDPKGKEVSTQVSEKEFLEFVEQTKAPTVDWCDLNASNIKRVIGCASPIDQLYPADFENYESVLLTMRGISEICRQGYLHKYTLGLSALQIQNKYADRYENLFKISDESAKETLSELIGLCISNLPTYSKDHDIKTLFAYCLKDLNGDGKDELLLMRENTFSAFDSVIDSIVTTDGSTVGGADAPETVTTSYQKYVVFAVMGEIDGRVELLGSYPEGAWIDADGQIIYRGKVECVNDEGRLETVEHFGVQFSSTSMLQITYFRTENGKRVEISAEEYNELSRKYAVPEDQEGYSTKILRILPKLVTEESYTLKIKQSGNTSTETPTFPNVILP